MSIGNPVKVSKAAYIRPIDFKNGRVEMAHGGGGRMMMQLIDTLFRHLCLVRLLWYRP